MSRKLSRKQVLDLLENVLHTYVRPASKAKSNIQFNCTVHGEVNPSAGFSMEKQVFNCFSCHASGNIEWLLFKSLDNIKSVQQARELLNDRYGLDITVNSQSQHVKRYSDFMFDEDSAQKRKTFSRVKLAPFKSGKETYEYFYDRGFTAETVEEFMIGRDISNETVTVPIFFEDGEVAGMIGRYIDPNRPKNSRYKIYWEFPRSKLLFPLDKFKPVNDTVILVEGTLDVVWLHQLGLPNALSIMNNKISYAQADYLKSRVKRAVLMYDDNKGGRRAKERTKDLLSPDVVCYDVEYPVKREDPQECNKEEIEKMLENKKNSLLMKEVARL